MPSQPLFDPKTTDRYHVSRSDIQLFLEDPRLFYLKHRYGIAIPPVSKSGLELTVKKLLKKEFNLHRVEHSTPPVMKEYGIDAKPFSHTEMDQWREDYDGLQTFDGPSNLIISGQVDDVWHNENGELIVVEFKSEVMPHTPPSSETLAPAHKRQIEVYQWILRQKGLPVSDTSYFIYAFGRHDKQALDAKLEFELKLITYIADASWVPETLEKITACLRSDTAPQPNLDSSWYQFYLSVKTAESKL